VGSVDDKTTDAPHLLSSLLFSAKAPLYIAQPSTARREVAMQAIANVSQVVVGARQLKALPVNQAHNVAARQAVASLVKNHGVDAVTAAWAVLASSVEHGYAIGSMVGGKYAVARPLIRYAKAVASSPSDKANKYWSSGMNGYARTIVGDARHALGLA